MEPNQFSSSDISSKILSFADKLLMKISMVYRNTPLDFVDVISRITLAFEISFCGNFQDNHSEHLPATLRIMFFCYRTVIFFINNKRSISNNVFLFSILSRTKLTKRYRLLSYSSIRLFLYR